MNFTMRFDDKCGPALEIAAAKDGISRSRYVARLIERELAELGPQSESFLPRQRGRKKIVVIRLDEGEIAAVDHAAGQLALRRNQWIVRRIRGGLVSEDGSVRLSPVTASALGEIISQVVRIGRNVNQLVHAINTAVTADAAMNLSRFSEDLMAMRDDIIVVVDAAETQLLEAATAEQQYWKG